MEIAGFCSVLSRPAVREAGRLFAVLSVKGVNVFAYGTWCFQLTHCVSQVFLSQNCVGNCENAYSRLIPSGLRSVPVLQANSCCLSLSFYFRKCHISNGAWGEIEGQERTVMDRLMPGTACSGRSELRYLHSWIFIPFDKRRPGALLLLLLWNYHLQVSALIWFVCPKQIWPGNMALLSKSPFLAWDLWWLQSKSVRQGRAEPPTQSSTSRTVSAHSPGDRRISPPCCDGQ